MKTLILSINCVNDRFDDSPKTFVAQINDELAKRIALMAEMVKKADIYRAERFDSTGVWSYKELDVDEDEFKDADYFKLVPELEAARGRVECNLLQVTEDCFSWSSVPKHCEDDVRLKTKQVPISFLDGTDPIYVDLT